MSKILKVVGASWLQTKISSYILGLLGVLAILALFAGQIERIPEDGTYAATVFYSKTGYRVEYWGQSNELADIPRGVARAYFRGDMSDNGWSLLEIETNSSYPDEIQAYAAGIVEGVLTWYLIHTHLDNTIQAKCEEQPMKKQCDKLRDTLDRSVKNWKQYADEHAATDPFWHHVSLYYTQINGIFTGWEYGVARSMNEYETDISDLYWLNSVSEVMEMQHKLNISLENSTLDHLPTLATSFLRIASETFEDGTATKKLFLAQNAAGPYSSMTRILKRYKFNFHQTSKDTTPVPGTTVVFTSYPGSVTSQDEFYTILGEGHKMAAAGTTLRNYNNELWKKVNITEQVPIGPRITAANHLATNVSTWGHILASSNSGTASKQWMIVDYNKFEHYHKTVSNNSTTPKKDVVVQSSIDKNTRHTIVYRADNSKAKGLAWLIEQVPGLTHSADISDAVLEQGYWATYGLPFFSDIANITHVKEMESMYGKIFSETESPRAVLFKRGFKNATSLESILELMRQNNVTAINRSSNETTCADDIDCMSKEDGYWSVLGTRGDMVDLYKEAYGVIDTKIVSGTLYEDDLEFVAVSSPPYTENPPSNETALKINRGNIATIYTNEFDNQPTINNFEIRNLVKQRREEAEKEMLEDLNKDVLKPFQWSESEFDDTHGGLPDRWDFKYFSPKWSW